MIARIVISVGVGSIIGDYGMSHGWGFGELCLLCLPVGLLIGIALNLIEGNLGGEAD